MSNRIVSAKEEWHVTTEERCWQSMTPTIGKRELHIFPTQAAACDWLCDNGFESQTPYDGTGKRVFRREEGMGYETMAWLKPHLVELVARDESE